MGLLLKEALKTLCGVNRWSYAVFWKIGSQNLKLLIWEECYYEPMLYYSPHFPGFESSELPPGDWDTSWVRPESRPSQPGIQLGDRVHTLLENTMITNQVNIVGEGMVGHAAFTGKYRWIVSSSYNRDAHPPEVLNEVHHQFSAGMKTVAVIPVLPHGVVQFGSPLFIQEDMGFVNDVKNLILELGCIPGAPLSENYVTKESTDVAVSYGMLVPEILSETYKVGNSMLPMTDNCQQSNISEASGLSHPSHLQFRHIPDNPWTNGSTFLNLNLTHTSSKSFEDRCQPMVTSVVKPNLPLRCQISTSSMPSGVSINTHHSTDMKPTQTELGGRGKMVVNDQFQDFSIPLTNLDEHTFLIDNIPDFANNFQMHAIRSQIPESTNAKYEDGYAQTTSEDDLYDILGVDFKNKILNDNWSNMHTNDLNPSNQNHVKDTSGYLNVQDEGSDFNSVRKRVSESDLFSRMGTVNHLDDEVFRPQSTAKKNLGDNVSCRTTMTMTSSSSVPSSCPTNDQVNMLGYVEGESLRLYKPLLQAGAIGSSSFRSGCSTDEQGNSCQTTSIYGSQKSSWIDQGHNVKSNRSGSTAYSNKPDEINKSSRKRLKPGEYPRPRPRPRPRPKDRQMIQDRVKELREIIPNGAKCSIDALLERTIRHMLFLQSVTQHAEKLKQTGESKIMNKEGGLILKDNFEGGATWAFEVGSNYMVCPIIVEDLNRPRQMLVEMLCEEHGFFLEIADLIRGLGLTILNGVMEATNDKIWAHFIVEANRDVSRMEIFMSLVCLLEQSVKGISPSAANTIDNKTIIHHSFPEPTSIPAAIKPSSLK